MQVPTIRTDRLILREWKNSDASALYELNSDPKFVKYLGEGKPLSQEDNWRVLALLSGHWVLKGFGIWAVELAETREVIGRVGLWEPEGWPGVELAWGISPEHWGKGYATEAAMASLTWGFETLDLPAVISIIHPENETSRKVALRIGESFSHSECIKHIHCHIYRITQYEFRQKRHN